MQHNILVTSITALLLLQFIVVTCIVQAVLHQKYVGLEQKLGEGL